jgi:hypothetical protein
MFKIFAQYKHLDKSILSIITAHFFIQFVEYAFLTILLIYMNKAGYADYKAADFFGYRFLSVLLFSFYLGLYINGRKIKPFFYISAICAPLLSLGIIFAIQYHLDILIYILMFLFGVSILGLDVSIIPYLLRNVKEEYHTEAISLCYATNSLGGILSGGLIWLLTYINPELFDEKMILKIVSIIGLGGIYFVFASKKQEFYVPILKKSRYDFRDVKWWLVTKAMVPTLLIATGAGLAIPFMGLFFTTIHHMTSSDFAVLTSFTTLFVFVVQIYVPNIQKKFGYKITITGSQLLAVLCLVGLSCSEFYSTYAYAAIVAICCYVLRQPLMNIAAPITSDLTMKFVGFRHREIVSSLTTAIWSGSWFFSAIIFKVLRTHEVQYAYIFFLTALLYVFGILWYYYLIVLFEKGKHQVY